MAALKLINAHQTHAISDYRMRQECLPVREESISDRLRFVDAPYLWKTTPIGVREEGSSLVGIPCESWVPCHLHVATGFGTGPPLAGWMGSLSLSRIVRATSSPSAQIMYRCGMKTMIGATEALSGAERLESGSPRTSRKHVQRALP